MHYPIKNIKIKIMKIKFKLYNIKIIMNKKNTLNKLQAVLKLKKYF